MRRSPHSARGQRSLQTICFLPIRRRPHHGPKEALPKLMLGAIGVVYGDIGTSPLYTMKESFLGPHPLAVDRLHIFGVLSLIFWSLMLIVTVKYVLRRDARRQQGRRRLVRAAVADRAQPRRQEMDAGAGHARRARDLPVLRRRDDHAGDLGPVRGRGAGRSVKRRLQPLVIPDLDRHPHRPVPRPVARHGEGRARCSGRSSWSISRCSRCSACRTSSSTPKSSARSVPHWALRFFLVDPKLAFLALGLGVPRGHRRRDALCRHGPFRPQGDRLFVARRSSIRA